MPSKRKSTSSSVAVTVAADSTSGESPNKSRRKANLIRPEAVAASSPAVEVEKNEASNADAATSTVDGTGSDDEGSNSRFVGDPVPEEEARRRWPKRYQEKVNFHFSDA